MSNIGSSKIAEMYVGSTKIAQAYVGTTLVFQVAQPPAGYDSYIIHLTWPSNHNFSMAGLHIDGVQPSASDVTMKRYQSGSWETVPSSTVESAIQWGDQGTGVYGSAVDISFTADNTPSTVQVKTGRWYGGDNMTVTMHVAGVKDGVETDLGYTTATNAADLTYTVNIS